MLMCIASYPESSFLGTYSAVTMSREDVHAENSLLSRRQSCCRQGSERELKMHGRRV